MTALITFNGTVGLGSILTFLTAVVGFATVLLETRRTRSHVSKVESKVDEVNSAVNGVGPERQPLVKNVQDIHDQLARPTGTTTRSTDIMDSTKQPEGET